MKLTILGNRSPYPVEEGGCSGYLLQTDKKNILIDIGSGVLSRLDKLINYYELDAVIISHLHDDHWLDLYPLHYAIKRSIDKGQRKEALAVYLPFEEGIELDYIQNKLGAEYHLQPIKEEKRLELGTIKFDFKLTEHSKECYALRISQGENVIGYTADTAWQDSLIDFFTGVDMLLAEATLLPEDKQPNLPHLTVEEAANLGSEAKAKKTILTHLGAGYELAEIQQAIPEQAVQVELSRVLESYTLPFD